jgi:hypothetical protein
MKSVLFRPTGRFNSSGQEELEPIFLNNHQTRNLSLYNDRNRPEAGFNLRINAAATGPENATGYQILTDTLTYIKQQQTEQKFYTLNGLTPSDYFPVIVGDGSWAGNILTRRTYRNGGDFEAGLVRQGSHNARETNTTVSMDSISLDTFLWDDAVQYNLMEIEQALYASNWDIIADKHAARREKFQLGIQLIWFMGTRSGNMEGLLVNTQTNVNTSLITKYISSMNAAEFTAFVAGLMSAYSANTNKTALPTHFVIPWEDWLGLQVLVPGTAGTFPVPMLTYLEQAFKKICGEGFKIIGNAYCDADTSNSLRGINKNTYALYRYDPKSIRTDLPVDFTTTQPNSIDNFNFQDVAYAQMTGLGFYRPLETLLFQFNGS